MGYAAAMMDSTTRVPFEELVAFGARLLERAGGEAGYLARVAVTAEGMGNDTHGLRQLLYLHKHMGQGGKIDPRGRPVVKREEGATAWVDGGSGGGGGAGQLAARLCVERAMELAGVHGVGLAGCGGTHWIGALGPFLLPVLENGMLAVMHVQFSTGRDAAPVGGLDPRFATDPMALCFPCGEDPLATQGHWVLADFSVTAYSHGRVNQMRRDGERSPVPVFMDAEGGLSDDPEAFEGAGTMLFMGGDVNAHKGYALGLWAEAMAALTGGEPNHEGEEGAGGGGGGQSLAVTVIDPAAFVGAEAFRERMRAYVEHLYASRPREGSDAIRLPGERGLASLARSQREGVAVSAEMREKLGMTREG